jgi:hypothetical protein
MDVVPAGAEDDHLRLVSQDDAVGEVGAVLDLAAAEAAVEHVLARKSPGRASFHRRIVEEPVNTMPPSVGGLARSAASKAAISFSHRAGPVGRVVAGCVAGRS